MAHRVSIWHTMDHHCRWDGADCIRLPPDRVCPTISLAAYTKRKNIIDHACILAAITEASADHETP